jgi:hypothetical protein
MGFVRISPLPSILADREILRRSQILIVRDAKKGVLPGCVILMETLASPGKSSSMSLLAELLAYRLP